MEQYLEVELMNFMSELSKEDQTEECILDILKLLEMKEMIPKSLLQKLDIQKVILQIRICYQNSNVDIFQKCELLLNRWKGIMKRKPKKNEQSIGEISNEVVQERDERDEISIMRPSQLRHQTYTITFGDQAENHVGMQKIGTLSTEGFSFIDLQRAKGWFEERGKSCELIPLHESLPSGKQNSSLEAYVLVVRQGVSAILNSEEMPLSSADPANDLMMEQFHLPKDTQAFMYGRVVQKHARYNLCFSTFDQEPDYLHGKGRVISYDTVPLLKTLRGKWGEIIGDKGRDLEAEGNYYYDLSKCGIGYHGDTERMKVIAVRMGESIPLYYVWYENSKPISHRIRIDLGHGDVYFMSQKATGQDWKKKLIPTLRHATGVEKFVKLAS
jgi:hypothetical protein